MSGRLEERNKRARWEYDQRRARLNKELELGLINEEVHRSALHDLERLAFPKHFEADTLGSVLSWLQASVFVRNKVPRQVRRADFDTWEPCSLVAAFIAELDAEAFDRVASEVLLDNREAIKDLRAMGRPFSTFVLQFKCSATMIFGAILFRLGRYFRI